MSRSSRFFRYWLPVLLWMAAIFVGSTDLLSGAHTSHFLGPLLRWLIPGGSDELIGVLQLGIRKTGHAVEYAVLAALLWRVLNRTSLGVPRPWPVKPAWQVWLLATAYAATDEFHQSFIASREGQVRDVLVDSAGAAVAVALIWWRGRRRGRWLTETAALSPCATAVPSVTGASVAERATR